MKAMILAAGLGTRMRPLTLHTPKPLIALGGMPLLQHHIVRLRAAGVTQLVINVSWLAEKIISYFGDGSDFGVSIQWSREQNPLETGGGIRKALKHLGDAPFVVVNGDIWSDFDFAALVARGIAPADSVHLVMVNNPEHNLSGDFGLEQGRIVAKSTANSLTFSGISVMSPTLFESAPAPGSAFPLLPLFLDAIAAGRVSGECWQGAWFDVGSQQRFEQASRYVEALSAADLHRHD